MAFTAPRKVPPGLHSGLVSQARLLKELSDLNKERMKTHSIMLGDLLSLRELLVSQSSQEEDGDVTGEYEGNQFHGFGGILSTPGTFVQAWSSDRSGRSVLYIKPQGVHFEEDSFFVNSTCSVRTSAEGCTSSDRESSIDRLLSSDGDPGEQMQLVDSIAPTGTPDDSPHRRTGFDDEADGMGHSFVIDLAKIASGEEKRTTCMIRNIPSRRTQEELLGDVLNVVGERVAPDCVSFPVSRQTGKSKGFAFMNFRSPMDVAIFYKAFQGFRWRTQHSEKVSQIFFAKSQGRDELQRVVDLQEKSKDAVYPPKSAGGLDKALVQGPQPPQRVRRRQPKALNRGTHASCIW